VNDRINFVRAYVVRNVVVAITTAICFASAAAAQATPASSRQSPIQLEAAVSNQEPAATRVTVKAEKKSPGATRPRVKAQKSVPVAPALKLETKEAARQVLRNDRAARQQLASVRMGKNISPNIMRNLHETATKPMIEMGDRPARSLSLCGDGKNRKFAELDSKTVAALLPEFTALRPRTVCARRGVLIADYAFK
jgi:hypothetical protein